MNNKERMELAKWASDYALKKGASQASVSISRSRSVQLEVREQKVETIRESTDNNLSLQIYRDNKFSGHSTNNLQKTQLERFISEAVEATAYLSPDPDRELPDPSLYPADLSTDLGLYDPAHADVSPEFRIEQSMKTEQLIRDGYKDILSANASFNDNTSEGVRVHSNGFEGEFISSYFGAGASVTILDEGSRPAGGFFAGGRFLDKLPSSDLIAEKALFDTLRQRGQKQIKSGKYNMIVDNRVAGNLMWRLFQPMTARSIQQKNSFLLDKIDTPIASEFLTIIDNPLIVGGLASRLYDTEGIAARSRTMVDKGVLKAYYIDNYYGRKLGMTPNGGSASNIIMSYGDRNQDQIIAAQEKAILITSFNGGNANGTTGDFSFGISGQLIENGKIVQSVNEMNISGNFQNLLKQLTETGNDPYTYSSMQTPTMVFQDVDFSGL
jgi:PmbA protein